MVGRKPWEEFGGEAESDGKGVVGHARDLGLSAVKSAIAVPEAVVGLADIPTGGRVGKFLENEGGALGFRPREAKELLSDLHTDQYKAQQQQFQEADGVLDKTTVALQNPSLIANAVTESIAPMLAGGVAARGVMGATMLGQMGAKGAAAAGAIGEGTMMAGSQAEAIRQETDDGLLTPTQAGAAVATGALGTLFGYLGGRVAQRFGLGDVDTMIAQGAKPQAVAGEIGKLPAKSIPRQVVEGAISEGFLEELPQSISEQIIQNLALEKPWSEGVEDAAVMGTLAGMAMGGGASFYSGMTRPAQPTEEAPPPAAEAPQDEPRGFGPAAERPIIDDAALARAGVFPPAPAPIINERALETVTPSQQMGLDPAAGPMSAAAALAVDTGASAAMQQAAQAVDPETGEILQAGAKVAEQKQAIDTPDQMRERLGFIEQQARTNGGWDRRLVEERDRLQAELTKVEPVADQDPIKNESLAAAGAEPAAQASDQNQPAADETPSAEQFDVSGRTSEQLQYLSASGQPGWKEAATAEIQRRDAQQPAATPALSAETAQPVLVEKPTPAVAQQAEASAPTAAPVADELRQQLREVEGKILAAASDAMRAGGGDIEAAMKSRKVPVTLKAQRKRIKEQLQQANVPERVEVAAQTQEASGQEGEKTFAPETGTLGIPRAEMPQVPSKSHGGLVKHLNAQGIAHETTSVDAASLKPTQAEYSPEKVEAAKTAAGDRAVIVSGDGHIVDGHHQVLAAAEQGKQVKAIVLDAPIDQALEAVKNSPSAQAATPAPSQRSESAQPGAEQPEALEFTTLKDRNGKTVTVRTADLSSARERMPMFTKDGKRKATHIHRDNLDLTGEKRAEGAKEIAANPLFNIITAKDGKPFAIKAAASRELNARGLAETHEVVPAGDVQAGMKGYVVRKKADVSRTADAAQGPSAALPDFSVFYNDENGVRWGIPYAMRQGQQPKDIKPEFRGDWVRLSGAKWSGNRDLMPAEQQAMSERLQPGEWVDVAQPAAAATEGDTQTAEGGNGATGDQDAHQPEAFVSDPGGSIDFGEITPEMALAMRRQAGKIRLQRGDDSFGERHIEIRHGDDIRRLGFNDVASFVADIARNINQVWQPGKTAQLVAIHELANDRVMFVELRGAQDEGGDYYTVRSAFPARKGFIKNKGWNLLWEDGRAQPSTNASSSAPFAEPAQDIAGGPATIPSGQSSDETVAQRPAAGDVPDVRRSPAGQNARTDDVEFPLQEAQASYAGISHSGTSRGKADADEFHAYIDAARDAGLAVATTAAQKAAVEQATADLRAEYLRQYRRLMSVRSGTYSGYVAGRSGLNSKQADKRNSAYDRAIDTFVAWQKASQDSPRKAAMAARTPEQIQADQQAAESVRQEKEGRKESRDRKLMERILSWKKGGEPVAITKIANLAGVNYGKDGYPTSIKLAPTDGSTLTDDKFDLAALFREKGMSVPDSKRRVRELVDAVRAESAADGEASLSAQHEALMASVRTGKATPEAFKASFEQVVSNEAAIKAELSAKTKAELLRDGGPYLQMRYANEKKDGVVDAVYRQMIGEYALGETVSYGIARDSYQKAVRRMVEATDADKLAQYVRDREAAIREAEVRRTARAEAMANPQTLNDYRSLMNAHIREGKTRHEAFLMLTPEQRIRYDELEAEGTREAREARKRAAQTDVRAAGQTTGGQIIATKHTRDRHDLFVVQLADRLSREDYNTVLAGAKRLGGRYSAFRGNGAVPGFQFRTREDAEAFLKLAGGDVSAAKDQVEQRRDAFADDMSQTAAERLVEMADRMEQEANAEESRDRKANTARRARFASAALNAAAAQKAMARTMRNIAQAIQDGKAKFLDAVRTRTQVEALLGYVRTAKDNELRAKYPSYAEQEKRKGEPATAETAGFADFPSYTAFRSDLAMLGRQMLEIDGTKKLGQKLMSVADDVTDAYLEFARNNIRAVSQFGRGDALAEFASRDDAERAIRRSGLVGKAIVLPIKRGQNRVILSPSESMSRKVWAGDGDKRITLSGEFGKELVEAIGRRGNKTNGLAVPWQFQNAYDRRKLLSRIGIETPSEFRSALREVIGLQETAVANKVREMELAMVGRRADGLDFFPTPAEIADQMVEAAEITPDMAVLEPSAGMGHIADRIREAGAEPDVVEISADRRELLEEKGYHVAEVNDFMNMEPRSFFTYGDIFRAPDGKQGILRGLGGMGSQRVRLEDEQGNRLGLYNRDEVVGVAHRGSWSGYDRIIMNPPFSDRRDAEHVRHAYTLLRPGGRVVAIMGEGVFFGQDKRAQDFRDWLESVGGTSEKLPEGSFMDPALPVQTGVNARMVVIDRPTVDGGDRQPGDADPEVAFSATSPRDRNALLTGITEKGLVRAMRLQFGELSEVTQKMLERGRAGKRGGAIVINTADMREVGRIVAEKTGRDLDSTMRKFSTAGVVNGFYDPKSGLTFLVGPNLNPVTATAVLLHEVMHGQQRQKIDQRAMEMVRGRESVKDPAMRAFLDRVARRMAMAGESNKASEASTYIVEQAVIEGRSAGYQFADNAFLLWADKTLGKRVGDFLRSFLGMVRTWALRNGMGTKTMTIDDFVGYAMAGMDRAADGEVRGRSVTVSASMGQDEQFRETERAYGGREAWQQARDAGRTKLNYGQWVQVRTPAFKAWFGDWENGRDFQGARSPDGSTSATGQRAAGDSGVQDAGRARAVHDMVLDPDTNEPRVFLHGTRDDIAAFDLNHRNRKDAGWLGRGVYVTSDNFLAESYSNIKAGEAGANVMPLFVRATSPYMATLKDKQTASRYSQAQIDTVTGRMKAAGHDGAALVFGDGTVELVVFDPRQVKSATGNRGTFDPDNDDIRFSRSGLENARQAAKNIGDGLKSITVQDVKKAGKHKLTDWLKLGLQFLGRRQLVDVYGDVLPLAEYDRLAAQMEADKNDVGASADDLARRWGKLPDESKLADLMHDATLAQIDADDTVEYAPGDDLLKSHMLKAQFAQLSPEAQKVYREARDHYRKHHAEVRQAITDRIMRSELREERRAELLKRMDDDFFKSIKGVYFPLARFGQYVVVTKDDTGKVASVSRAETMAEAEAMRQEMVKAFPAKDGYQVGRVILSKEFIAGRDMVGRGFMSELFNALDEQQLDPRVMAELEDTLGQLYLSSLPDLSWAKHGIHRKGTPGFSNDARRAFAQNAFHGARYLAKLRYGDQMQAELDRMQKHVDEMSAIEGFDQPAAQRVVDEMNKRHEAMMNPKSNPLSTALTSFGFVYYLGISPAAAMVNLSQTPLVAYPVMGAKWGFRKAGAALMAASKETMEGKNDLRSRLKSEDEIAAYDEAVRTGVIDVTMAHDLAGIAQGEDAKVMWKIRPVMRAASFLFHHAERFNRQATFLAAYRLARDAGSKHDTAYAQAVKATYDGHFDYSAGNRPRVMQGNVAKVVLLFKQYAQNMIYTIARNAYQSVKGESPEVRREARKVFASLMTMHAAAAGVLGLPMVGTLLALASALGGSDDEPWDAEVALRNMLADAFGPKTSEVIARGFSRLTPWDVSGRVGLDKLLLPDVNESLEGQRWAEAFATAMLGPVIGMGVNAAKGAQKMSDGDYARGLEDMLPIFARNPIKAYRQYSEGEVDRTGVVIKDEVSLAGVLGQASGFSPSEIRLAFEGRSAVMSADRRLNERRQDLMTQFARAAMEQDQSGMAEARSAIAEFNKVNPGRRITPPQLWQSVRNRQRRIRESEDGVYLPRTRRDVLDVGRFAEAV
ncbi:MAG: PLxRFG domain-containing protein [Thauera propionica]|jgi:hypothetical protein|nr:PLxRFG domain-containing protein [Thauera propionica]